VITLIEALGWSEGKRSPAFSQINLCSIFNFLAKKNLVAKMKKNCFDPQNNLPDYNTTNVVKMRFIPGKSLSISQITPLNKPTVF